MISSVIWPASRSAPDRQVLRAALGGQLISGLASPTEEQQDLQRQFDIALIETYVPVRADGTGRVIAVAQFFLNAESLMEQIRGAQDRPRIRQQ